MSNEDTMCMMWILKNCEVEMLQAQMTLRTGLLSSGNGQVQHCLGQLSVVPEFKDMLVDIYKQQ